MTNEFLSLLIKHDITPNEFVLLKCVAESDKKLLTLYMDQFGKYQLVHILKLVKQEFLTIPAGQYEDYLFTDLQSTDKFKKLFKNNLCIQEENDIFTSYLNELYNTYPKVINGRRLIVEKDTCKKLYKSIINSKVDIIDVELHNVILKCIKYEIEERTKSGNLAYIWQLPRYLRHKNWEVYMEDVLTHKTDTSNDGKDI